MANRPENTRAFDRNPPHFSLQFSASIPFADICPNYANLDDDTKELLPLVLAQLVNHYHHAVGLRQLGHDNPLRNSPLWFEPKWIAYRAVLHTNLLGGHKPECLGFRV